MTRASGGRTLDRLTDPGAATKHWRYLAAVGGVLVAVGLSVMVFPLVFGAAIRLVVGGGFILSGIPLVWHAIRSQGSLREFAVELVLGVFYLGAGLSLLVNAGGGVVALVAIFVVVAGLILVFFGVRQRPRPGWTFPIVGGGASIVLGVLVWVGWPNSEPATVGLLAGLALVVTGVPLVAVARRMRQQTARESS